MEKAEMMKFVVGGSDKDSEGYICNIHLCEDEIVADAVAENIKERHPSLPIKIEEVKPRRPCYDAGGALLLGTEWVDLKHISYLPHHLDNFLFSLNKALSDVRESNGIRFCKIRSNLNIVCVYEETAIAIKNDINDRIVELRDESNNYLNKWDEKIKELQASKHILIQKPTNVN